MNEMVRSFAEWFRSKNITSHTVVALLIGAATLITTDEQVRDLLIQATIAHPKIASTAITVAGIILKYSRDSSTRGAAQNILADANVAAPTPVMVTPPATITKEAVTPDPQQAGAKPAQPIK